MSSTDRLTLSFPVNAPRRRINAWYNDEVITVCYESLADVLKNAQAFKNHTDFEEAVCVILDVNLRDGSGIELTCSLKAAGNHVPIIYMTGNISPAIREAALASGCIAFLAKPFSAQALIEPLGKASAGRSRAASWESSL